MYVRQYVWRFCQTGMYVRMNDTPLSEEQPTELYIIRETADWIIHHYQRNSRLNYTPSEKQPTELYTTIRETADWIIHHNQRKKTG
jgi:hypothetical protein